MRKKVSGSEVIVLANYPIQMQAQSINNIMAEVELPLISQPIQSDDLISELRNPQSYMYNHSNSQSILLFLNPGLIKHTDLSDYINALIESIGYAQTKLKAPIFLIWMPSKESHSGMGAALESLKSMRELTVIENHMLDYDNVFDEEMEALVYAPYSKAFYDETTYRMLKAMQRVLDPAYKVIVVDADNTLWEGACAEGELSDITIHGPYEDLQKFLIQLEGEGWIICLNSKNIESDVFHVIDNHCHMLMGREHFSHWRVNWDDKADNLMSLSEDLNLDLASFIFIDDRPEECANIQSKIPEVMTILFSSQGHDIETIKNLWIFNSGAKQGSRTGFYQANHQREKQKRSSISYADFIESLNMDIELVELNSVHMERIAELSHRTTQFNCRNSKLTAKQLVDYSSAHSYVARIKDRFGDYGISGFISSERKNHILWIKDFFVSCRALNKGVEHRIIREIALRNKDSVKFIAIPFIKTIRNEPSENFLNDLDAEKKHIKDYVVYMVSINHALALSFIPKETSSNVTNKDNRQARLFHGHALLALAKSKLQISSYISGNRGLESELRHIWSSVLPEKYSDESIMNSSLPTLGVSSLGAVEIAVKINKAFGVNFGIKEIYENDTVHKQVQCIQERNVSASCSNEKYLGPMLASSNQTSLYMLDKIHKTWGFNMPSVYSVRGAINYSALTDAITGLIKAHPILNSNFHTRDNSLELVISDVARFSLQIIEMPKAKKEDLLAYCKEQERRPFDLDNDLLIRVSVIKIASEEHLLIFNVHHVVFDGWSEVQFFQQLANGYNKLIRKEPFTFHPSKHDYFEYCRHQQEWLTTDAARIQSTYWRERLRNASYTEIDPDVAGDNQKPYQGSYTEFKLPEGSHEKLNQIALSKNTTVFNILFSLFNLVVSKYVNKDDILLGCPFWGRPSAQFSEALGYFVNLVLLRTYLTADATLDELIRDVTKNVKQAQLNQNLPFAKVVEQSSLMNQDFNGPKIQFSYHKESVLSLDDLIIERFYRGYDLARSGFIFEIEEAGLKGGVYHSSGYSKRLISSFIHAYMDLVSSIDSIMDRTIKSIPLYAEMKLSTSFINPSYKPTNLISIFEKTAESQTDNIALRDTKYLTFSQLNEESKTVAANLQSKGFKPGDIIGISLDKSISLVVTSLGIARMGATYVSLDSSHPDKYLRAICKSSDLKSVITEERHYKRIQALSAAMTYEELSCDYGKALQDVMINPETILYILYTSGTTGQPKGVKVSHANFYNLYRSLQNRYHINSEDKMAYFHSYGFDVGQWEMWSCLLNGCELVIPTSITVKSPQKFIDFLLENKITVLCQTPSAFEHLTSAMLHFSCKSIPSLRLVVFTGEPLDCSVLEKFPTSDSQPLDFFNMYGITEVTVYSTIKKVSLGVAGTQLDNMGQPLDNTAIFILDESMQPKPMGAIGEIYLAGYGVAQGYHNNTSLTHERFKKLPGTNIPLYKSGDMGRILDNGDLEFYGRIDEQIKIRGHRLDLRDVSKELNECCGVNRSVVIVEGDCASENTLRGIVEPDKQQSYPTYMMCRLRERDPTLLLHKLPNNLTIAHSNPFETETLYEEIFLNNEYIKNGVELKDNDVIIDIGANIGMFTLRMALSQLNLQIYAYEPIPPIYNLLKKNIQIYNLENVRALNFGVYDRSGDVNFDYYPNASVLSTIHGDNLQEKDLMSAYIHNKYPSNLNPNTVDSLIENQLGKETYACKLTTVSRIIEDNGLTKIDLLKIDAEKSELNVLLGIKDKHWAMISQIAMEVHDLGDNVSKSQSILVKHGFTVQVIENIELKQTGLIMLFALRHSSKESQTKLELNCPNQWTEDLIEKARAHLEQRLPSYMLPSYYHIVSELPLTMNGKLDKKTLAKLTRKQKSAPKSSGNNLEQGIAKVWRDVLKSEDFTYHDSFFEVGGNSLMLMHLYEKLETMLEGLEITDLFRYPTVNKLASAFSNQPINANNTPDQSLDVYDQDIAVIGYSFRLPDTDYDTLWSNFLEGQCVIKEFSRQELLEFNADKLRIEQPNFIAKGSLLNNIDSFDAKFFGIRSVEAIAMDPQHRVLMELAWEALERSGYSPEKHAEDIGIACGVGANYYTTVETPGLLYIDREMFSQKDFLPTKIAYNLDLKGPAYNINTACSTGLVNVIKACQSLLLNEADIMLAGAGTLVLPGKAGYNVEEGSILSTKGECIPFDENASGTVLGSGAVIFTLKKLSKALDDNDNIHAIIKGYAINNDGNEKMSYAAPSIDGQKRCIEKALRHANVSAKDISYVEAHGTGTKLGDPIELRVLEEIYASQGALQANCGLGSSKANYGHTDTASGALGLLKAILILNNKVIPPQFYCSKPIISEKSPFHMSSDITVLNDMQPYAAVSSFGLGGTNAHMIIQAPKNHSHAVSLLPNIVLLSAKTKQALQEQILRLKQYISYKDSLTEQELTAICYTLQCGRNDFQYKKAYVIRDLSDLLRHLSSGLNLTIEGNSHLLPDAFQKHLSYWLEGKVVDWNTLYVEKPRKMILPTYPFQHKKYLRGGEVTFSVSEDIATEINEMSMVCGLGHDRVVLANEYIVNRVIKLFQELLGCDEVTLSDNFEDLGGDSMLAITILSHMDNEFGCKLKIKDILTVETIEDTINIITDSTAPHQTPKDLVCLQTGSSTLPPIFMIHPGNGCLFQYQRFIKHLDTPRTVYGIANQIYSDDYMLYASIEDIAQAYIKMIVTAQKEGPYTLAGWSFGGSVAFEMTRQLEQKNKSVDQLILIDSWAKHDPDLMNPAYFNQMYGRHFVEFSHEKRSLLIHRLHDGMKLLINYKPGIVKSVTILFKSLQISEEYRVVDEPDNHWKSHVANDLKIVYSQGDHQTIIEEPCIIEIAHQCKELLTSQSKEMEN